MFDFPTSPTEGQLFNPSGGPLYVFRSGVWMIPSTPPVMSIGDNFPVSPVPGQLHWESDTGNSFVWYDDGTSKQWVQFNIGAFPEAPLDAQTYVRQSGGWVAQTGVVKISEGTTSAATAALDIPLPTSGYQSFELIGQNLNHNLSGSYLSLCVNVAVASTYVTSGYGWAWDRIQATANPSAGWAAGANASTSTGMGLPWVQGGSNAGAYYFELRCPCLKAGAAAFSWIADGQVYGQGTFERQRSGGTVSVSGPPNILQLTVGGGGNTISAGFRWQLNGVR